MQKRRGRAPVTRFYRKKVVTSSLDFYLIERNRIVRDLFRLDKYGGKKVLDVGCGCGELLVTIRGRGFKVGVDVSSTAVTSAAYTVKKAFFVVCDAANLPFRKKCFDIAICSEVLEHVSSPEKVLRQINSVLKKRGIFIATVPNLVEIYGWAHLLLRLFPALRNGGARANLVEYCRTKTSVSDIKSPYLGHLHVKLPTSWRKMIVNSGFKVERSFGILLLPLRTLIYKTVGKHAMHKILKKEDGIRYVFPINYMSNGIGFIAQKV